MRQATGSFPLPSILQKRVSDLIGTRPISAQPISAGLTMARRWIVRFDNGTTAFLKAAANSATAQWLRNEHAIYQTLEGPHLPRLIGWVDQPPGPILLLEDLSHAHWPPPWSPPQIEAALEVIHRVHRTPSRPQLPKLGPQVSRWRSWHRVAADPASFLALNLCDRGWLDQSLPKLIAAENLATLDGDDLVHGDFTSGNICFDGNRAVLLDWNWAAIGNGLFDIAFWLPSLGSETGCFPESILPGQLPLAALIAGQLAHHAGLPAPAETPQLRELQVRKLRHALAWAARALSLPIPSPHHDDDPAM